MMINKEQFVKAVNALLEREKTMDAVREAGIEKLGVEIKPNPLEDILVTILDNALEFENPPLDGWVSWYLYDCYFSRSRGEPCVLHLGEKKYDIFTPEDLYDAALAFKAYSN